MAIYKLIRASKKNNLRLTVLWRKSGFTIVAKETNEKGTIRLSVGKVTHELRQALTMLEQISKGCTNAHSLKELIAEIEARYNMLIL